MQESLQGTSSSPVSLKLRKPFPEAHAPTSRFCFHLTGQGYHCMFLSKLIANKENVSNMVDLYLNKPDLLGNMGYSIMPKQMLYQSCFLPVRHDHQPSWSRAAMVTYKTSWLQWVKNTTISLLDSFSLIDLRILKLMSNEYSCSLFYHRFITELN